MMRGSVMVPTWRTSALFMFLLPFTPSPGASTDLHIEITKSIGGGCSSRNYDAPSSRPTHPALGYQGRGHINIPPTKATGPLERRGSIPAPTEDSRIKDSHVSRKRRRRHLPPEPESTLAQAAQPTQPRARSRGPPGVWGDDSDKQHTRWDETDEQSRPARSDIYYSIYACVQSSDDWKGGGG